MFKNLRYDIKSILERDPAARNGFEVFFLYSGFHALLWYRAAHFFYKYNLKFIARMISQWGRWATGVEIHPGAQIGRGLLIDHGMGVVIGETTIIGNDCTIYQGVTLGGTGKEKGKRHPTIGNNVMIGSGAKILGPFKVGDHAKIAAGAVVLSEVPEDCTAVGIPARVVRRAGQVVDYDLDQVKIPDPLTQQVCTLSVHLTKLEKEIEELKKRNVENENL